MLLLLAALAAPPSTVAVAADEGGPRCEWSEAWRQVSLPSFGPAARLVGPRRRKGKIRMPRSRQPHEIQGQWIVQLAIDARGRTMDARIIERPRVSPPWPEFEASVLEDARKLKWAPATADGVPVPVCMDLPVFSSPRRVD